MTTERKAENEPDLDAIMEQILAGTTFKPLPPAGFNPLEASNEELEEFGMPQRPNEQTHPGLFKFWSRMYAPPLEFVPVTFSFGPPQQLSAVNHRQQALGFRTRRQTSPNWSGAYIKPRDGQVFSSIWGQWQVPTPSVPPTALAAGGYYRCSTWIGFDGQRRYYHASLPQIGTAQSINDATGQLEFQAWWQWWVRDQYYPQVDISLPIQAGDLIMCNIQVLSDRGKVRLQMRNASTMSQSFDYEASAPTLPVPLEVSGATAEWITERPAIFPTDTLFDFPDYNTVLFSDCLAVSESPSGGPRRERRLEGAQLIDMRETRQSPSRTARISAASLVNEQQVMTVYR